MKKLKVIYLLLVFLFSGCATTKIVSIKNPEVSTFNFKKVLVYALTDNLILRKTAEDIFVEEFEKQNLKSVSALKLLGFQQRNENELEELLRKNDIDCCLLVILSKKYSSVYIPPTFQVESSVDNTIKDFPMIHQTIHQSGGYYISKPKLESTVILYSLFPVKEIWRSGCKSQQTTTTTGTITIRYSNKKLMHLLSKKIAQKLKEDLSIP